MTTKIQKVCVMLLLVIQLNPMRAAASSSSSSSSSASWPIDAGRYQTFSKWKEACEALPEKNNAYKQTALRGEELLNVAETYIVQESTNGAFQHDKKWLSRKPSYEELITNFTPYVQKLVVTPQTKIAFHGDLHGDIHSVNNFIQYLNNIGYLDGFKIIDPNFYMIFLGDYVDRGWYGAEAFYTILRLKCANPDRVFMTRGNHEDMNMNVHGGFVSELDVKFTKDAPKIIPILKSCYNLLPVALYLGCPSATKTIDYLLCCHGGLEMGFNPLPLLDSSFNSAYTLILNTSNKLDRMGSLRALSEPTKIELAQAFPRYELIIDKPIVDPAGSGPHIGFMWSDFQVSPEWRSQYTEGRGMKFNKKATGEILAQQSSDKSRIQGIFRAHQHADRDMLKSMLKLNKDHDKPWNGKGAIEDRGVAKLWKDNPKIGEPGALWKNIVCTFLISPNVPVGGGTYAATFKFNYDAFGILTTAQGFDNWKLTMFQVDQNKLTSPTSLERLSAASSSAFSSSSCPHPDKREELKRLERLHEAAQAELEAEQARVKAAIRREGEEEIRRMAEEIEQMKALRYETDAKRAEEIKQSEEALRQTEFQQQQQRSHMWQLQQQAELRHRQEHALWLQQQEALRQAEFQRQREYTFRLQQQQGQTGGWPLQRQW